MNVNCAYGVQNNKLSWISINNEYYTGKNSYALSRILKSAPRMDLVIIDEKLGHRAYEGYIDIEMLPDEVKATIKEANNGS